jgi:hypothetical protein
MFPTDIRHAKQNQALDSLMVRVVLAPPSEQRFEERFDMSSTLMTLNKGP